MKSMTVVPAYTRDYQSQAAVLADWNAGKDFMISDISAGRDDGRYINKRDSAAYLPGVTIRVRYNRLADVLYIKPPEPATETFERVSES